VRRTEDCNAIDPLTPTLSLVGEGVEDVRGEVAAHRAEWAVGSYQLAERNET